VSPPRHPRRAPSWLGTLVVAVAVAVMFLRAAAALRRSISTGAPSASPLGSTAPPEAALPEATVRASNK